MTLLVDLGNSRIKWSRSVGGLLTPMQAAPADGAAMLPGPADPDERAYWISSCGDADKVIALAARLQALGYAAVHRIGPPVSDGRLALAYTDPSTLGVDRWLAMRAAQSLASGAYVVASIGTAMTVDAVSADGSHIGGCIAPGPRVMRRALLASAEHLDIGAGQVHDFARSTADGVHSGPVLAAAALIERQQRLLAERSPDPVSVWLTGGDAAEVAACMTTAARLLTDLVLRGLHEFASD